MKWIKLTQGKRTMVDNDDFERLSKFKWTFSKYAFRSEKSEVGYRKIYLHWLIVGKPERGFQVDHINGNKLDNRRKNLRIVTHHQNCLNKGMSSHNKSGYKGVSWGNYLKKWIAQIQINKKTITLGTFDSKISAYKAYCKANKEYYKEFSRLK